MTLLTMWRLVPKMRLNKVFFAEVLVVSGNLSTFLRSGKKLYIFSKDTLLAREELSKQRDTSTHFFATPLNNFFPVEGPKCLRK